MSEEIKAEELDNTVEVAAVENPEIDNASEVDTGVETESQKGEKKDDLPFGVKKRFSVLTQRNKMLEEELYAIKAQLLKNNQKPLSRDEMTDDEWISHQVEQKLLQQKQLEIQRAQELQKEQKRTETIQAKISEFEKFVPDLSETLQEAAELPLPQQALDYLRDSDIAPLLAYRIAKDDELYDKIREASKDRSGRAMDRLLTKVELKLESELEAKSKSSGNITAPKSKPVGEIAPRSKNSSSETFDPTKLSLAEYRKWRASQK